MNLSKTKNLIAQMRPNKVYLKHCILKTHELTGFYGKKVTETTENQYLKNFQNYRQ